MAEKSKIESHSVKVTAMQSDTEKSKTKDSNSTGKDNDNITPHSQEGQQSNQKSKKKKKKSGKSQSSTSGIETLPSAEDVKPKVDPLMQQLIKQRISEIQQRPFKPEDYSYAGKITCQKPKEINTSNSGGDLSECSPKDKAGPYNIMKTGAVRPIPICIAQSSGNTSASVVSAGRLKESLNLHQNKVKGGVKVKDNVKSTSAHSPAIKSNGKGSRNQIANSAAQNEYVASYIRDLILEKKTDKTSGKITFVAKSLCNADYDGRLLSKDIHVKMSGNDNKIRDSFIPYIHDKSTQADPVQENPSSSGNDNKSRDSLIPYIHVMDKSTQTDSVQENPSSSGILECINISKLTSDLECTVLSEESGTTFPADASNLENISEEIDNFSIEGESLKSIKEDLLRDMKIASEKYEVNLMKCLKDVK